MCQLPTTSPDNDETTATHSHQRLSFEDEPVEHVWEAVIPVVVRLLDIVMQHPPVSTPRALPSEATRRAACTHLTMTRLLGVYRCYVCDCIPNIGWVYTCTQDHEGELRLDAGMDTSPVDMERNARLQEKNDIAADQLSGWIVKAIEDGHYTAEQIEILKAQKRKVKETITALEDPFRVSNGKPAVSLAPESSTTLPSIDSNPHLLPPVVTEAPETQSTHQTPEWAAQPRAKLFPDCRWKCCHACRPTYRDRSWQSLKGVLAGNMAPFTVEDFNNHRVTDANVARSLGLRNPPIFDAFEDINVESTEEEENIFSDLDLRRANEQNEEREEDSSSKGFRASVKRAFRGMLMSRRRNSFSSHISAKSRKRSLRRDGEDGEEFDIGLWRDMNDELLQAAADIRLPGDGMDGVEFEKEEVEVEGGVAVTEEAVDLRTADIIMSVQRKREDSMPESLEDLNCCTAVLDLEA